MTSLFPLRSTATISPVPQWANHNRPSCQRADSGMASPESRTVGEELDDVCDISASFFILSRWSIHCQPLEELYKTVMRDKNSRLDRDENHQRGGTSL